MKKILFLLLVLSGGLKAQTEDLVTVAPMQFKNSAWYKNMLSQVTAYNKIDSLDASMLKVTSSDSRISKESCSSMIKRTGKLSAQDLHAIAFNKKNDTLYYVISLSGVYAHLFVYDRLKSKLSPVRNTRPAVIAQGEKMVLNAVGPNLLIFAVKRDNDPDDWHKFHLYHVTKGSFTHFKNCHRVKGKVECESVKL